LPAVSIVVPVYNAEKYIDDCIKSILAQSFKDFELILVDDGSTDNSGKICDDYALKDKRVKPLHFSNAGVSSARNAGIDFASGEFIMFCDSDDYVSESWIEDLYNIVSQNSRCMVLCGYTFHDLRNGRERLRKIKSRESSYDKKDFYDICLQLLFYLVWNKIFNAKIIKENNIRFDKNISLGEDLLFCLEYLKFADEKILASLNCNYEYILRDRESLNYKYYENLKDINITLYSEIYRCMELFGSDIEKYSGDFYFVYLRMLTKTLDNTMNPQNNMGYFEKIKYNNQLMQSDIYKTCLNKAGQGEYSKLFLMCLKTGWYPSVIFYNQLCNLKRFPLKVKNKIKLILRKYIK